MDIAQAERLLDSYDRLSGEEAREKAGVVVNLVSDINNDIFEKIVSGGDKMSEALKRMVLPEFGELKDLLADKDAELADKDAELAHKDAEIADNYAKLADKDAEIAALKRMLAERDTNK